MAFARRRHGVREALSRRLLRSREDFTASNGGFLKIHVDGKKQQILNLKKANKTLFKSDAHIRISLTMSMEQQVGLLLV